MGHFNDLTGKIFGKLIALSRAQNSKDGKVQFLCKCECGKEKIIRGAALKAGDTKSCGCFSFEFNRELHIKRNTTHGMTGTKIFECWRNMHKRCKSNHRKHASYKRYNIEVCERWNSLDNFIKDMGFPPSPIHTLDRIDPKDIYEPRNCRWATPKEQGNNRANNRWIILNGESKTFAQWCNFFCIQTRTVTGRLEWGWPLEKAFSTPVKKRK